MSYSFSPYTPLYHEALDDWGLSAGTRVWNANGSFVPVESLSAGDIVFGISFDLEDEYLPLKDNPVDPSENIVKVWRPVLRARRVLGVETVTARAWQLTFGEHTKQYEARRLVGGADTHVTLFPLTHQFTVSKRLVDIQTAVAETNPRVGSGEREAMELDIEWSMAEGRPMYRPTPFTGQPCGELATIIPYEAYGGQTGMLRADIRPYSRYLFSQVREVVPVQEASVLYKLHLQPDTPATNSGVAPDALPRCNVICQTPFAEEKKSRRVASDRMSQEVSGVTDPADFMARWDEWAARRETKRPGPSGPVSKEKISTTMNGMFYDSQRDPEKAQALERYYGLQGGFLNGGILVDLPVDPHAHRAPDETPGEAQDSEPDVAEAVDA
jgi:hypothetical protein